MEKGKEGAMLTRILLVLALLTGQISTQAQQKFITNLSEDSVPPYTLPDPLQIKGGAKISSINQWESVQRPYIYHLYF